MLKISKSFNTNKKGLKNIINLATKMGIETKLPEIAQLVASNNSVPIAMFRIGSHIMSMQGHPEFTSEYAHAVATMRKDVLGKEAYEKASFSLKNETTDNVEVAKWWIDFFRYNNQ